MTRCLLIGLALLTFSALKAQEPGAVRPLQDVLSELEEVYEVTFNYASKLVEGKEVSVQDYSSLEEALERIAAQTGLEFFRISPIFVGIRRKRSIICGYIREADTGEQLRGALITAGTERALTDAQGYFEIQVESLQEIRIAHLGYRTEIIRRQDLGNESKCTTVFLEAPPQPLPEVVVYDYLLYGIDHLSNGSIQLDFDRLHTLPGLINSDVLQAVQSLPGIQSRSETVSEINIRGGSNDQNLILWDGIKMYQSGHFFGLISMYNPHLAQKVEVFKNGTPASFSDGVSGLIHMKSEPLIHRKNRLILGINLIDINGTFEHKIGDKLSLQLAGRKAIDDWVNTPTYESYLDRVTRNTELEDSSVASSQSDFDFYDGSMRLLYTPSTRETWRMNLIYTSNRISFAESAEIAGQTLSRRSSLNQYSIAGGLYYSRQWNQHLRTEVQLYETDYKLKAINANIPEEQRLLQENRVSETGFRFHVNGQLSPTNEWRAGYQFIESKITNLDDVDEPRFRDLLGEVLRTHAGYAEWSLRNPRGSLNMNAGLRANLLDKFDLLIWEPRMQLRVGLGSHWVLECLGEFKHQSTTQIVNFQNDFLGLAKRRWRLANEDNFPVLRSRQVSAGVQWNRKGWLLDGVAFLKEVEGIHSRTQGFLDSFQFEEAVGSYTSSGLDLLLRKQWERVNTWASYSFLRSTYDFETLVEATFSNNFELSHFLSGGIVVSPSEGLHIAAGANWHSGVPYTAPDTEIPMQDGIVNYAFPNGQRLREYLRVDVSASFMRTLKNDTRLKLNFSIWNLLNRQNEISRYYFPQEQQVVEQTNQALGITPNLSVEWQF